MIYNGYHKEAVVFGFPFQAIFFMCVFSVGWLSVANTVRLSLHIEGCCMTKLTQTTGALLMHYSAPLTSSHTKRDWKLMYFVTGFLIGFPIITQAAQLTLIGISTAKLAEVYTMINNLVGILEIDAATWLPNDSGLPLSQLAGLAPMAEDLSQKLEHFQSIILVWACIMLGTLIAGMSSGIPSAIYRINDVKKQVRELDQNWSISSTGSVSSGKRSVLQRVKRALFVDWTERELIKQSPSRLGLDYASWRRDLLASICDNIILGSLFFRVAALLLAGPVLVGVINNARGTATVALYLKLQVTGLCISTFLLCSYVPTPFIFAIVIRLNRICRMDYVFLARSRLNLRLLKPPSISFASSAGTVEITRSTRFVLTIGEVTTFKLDDPTQSISESSQA